jgi:hypothetical protein
MDTFIPPRKMVANPGFLRQRENSLERIPGEKIDPPVLNIIQNLSRLPYCFSIQSCCGHFIYGDRDLLNTTPLPELTPSEKIEYRVGFMALCLEESPRGKNLYDELSLVPLMDEDYIQFGSAEWFWDLQVNSYVLQVAPERFRNKDKMFVSYPEALHIEQVRNRFLEKMEELLANRALFRITD